MRFELELAIAASPEEVFDFLSDPTNLPRWQESCVAVEQLDEDRIRETRSFMGHRAQVETEIVERERPHTFTVRSLGGPVRFTVRHDLSPSGDGTQLRVKADGSAIGGRLTAGVVARVAERQFRSDFERLREILES